MQPWTCAHCLVPCGAQEIKCPACQELRPGCTPSDAEESSSPDQPSIQFGAALAAKAAESSSNGTPAFGPTFGAMPLPSHDPFGASPFTSTATNQQVPLVPPFPRAASPTQHPVFGSHEMSKPDFGASDTPAKAGFTVQFGSQLSSSPEEEGEEATPDKPVVAATQTVNESVEKENHSQSDSNKASSGRVDAGRFTFGISQLTHDFSSTPTTRPAPPSPVRASGQPSPGRFLDALATTPVGTSGADSPFLRDYDPRQPKPYPKRDTSRRGILYNWGSGECDQLAVRQECLEEGMCLQPMIIRRVNQPIAKSIVCGAMHSACVVDHGHAVWTWGCNDEKALGRPVRLDTKRRNADGEVYEIKIDGPLIDPCWNTVHPPPDNSYYLCKAPGPVWGLPDKVEIVKVTAGDSHTAIITATGDCWVWGTYRDGTGPLGFPDFSKEPGTFVRHQIVPVKVPGLLGSCIRLISGENHTVVMTYCARDRKYRVYAWGANPYGQLGGTPTDHENPRAYLWPREIKLSDMQFMIAQDETSLCVHPKNELIRRNGNIADIYGGRATLFIQVSHEGTSVIFGMGRNACGELGAGCEITCVSTPVALKTPPGYVWKDIKGGDWFTMGYTHDGAVFTWGHCEYVGQGSEIAASKKNVLIPKKLPGLRQMVAEITASDKAAYIVTYAGELFVWGENQSGQLGLRRQDEQPVARPTHVPASTFGNQPVLSVAAGSQHAVAMIQADEAQLERGTKRRRENDEKPAEDMEVVKRRRGDGEVHHPPQNENQADNSRDPPTPLQPAPVPTHVPNHSTLELPAVAPPEVSPSKLDQGYISDDDEPKSGSASAPEEDGEEDQNDRPPPRHTLDIGMAGAKIGMGSSAAEEDEEEEESQEEELEHQRLPVGDIESDSPPEVNEESEKEEEQEESDEEDEPEAPPPHSQDAAKVSEAEEESESEKEISPPKKSKAKAKAKARPKKAAEKPNVAESKPETTRGSRKRLPPISATPADGDVSDISQPTEAGAPKRTRATTSAIKKEERGVKRQASGSPEREDSARSKKARTVRTLKKGPASQETTPLPLPPAAETTTKTRGRTPKAAPGDSTTTATAGRKKAAPAEKPAAAEKAVTEKKTLRRGKTAEEAVSPPVVEEPPKKTRTRAPARTQSQQETTKEAPAAAASKTAPKRAAAKPKAKAKSQPTKVVDKAGDETEEDEEEEPQAVTRKAAGTAAKGAASKASKSQPVTTVKSSTTTTKRGAAAARSQPEEEGDGETTTTKKGAAKAKAKEMPRRATRSQATKKESEAEPPAAGTTRKTTRAKK